MAATTTTTTRTGSFSSTRPNRLMRPRTCSRTASIRPVLISRLSSRVTKHTDTLSITVHEYAPFIHALFLLATSVSDLVFGQQPQGSQLLPASDLLHQPSFYSCVTLLPWATHWYWRVVIAYAIGRQPLKTLSTTLTALFLSSGTPLGSSAHLESWENDLTDMGYDDDKTPKQGYQLPHPSFVGSFKSCYVLLALFWICATGPVLLATTLLAFLGPTYVVLAVAVPMYWGMQHRAAMDELDDLRCWRSYGLRRVIAASGCMGICAAGLVCWMS